MHESAGGDTFLSHIPGQNVCALHHQRLCRCIAHGVECCDMQLTLCLHTLDVFCWCAKDPC